MRLDQLAVHDHAPPRAGLELLHLDERLEAGEVGAHGTLDVAHPTGRLLDQRARSTSRLTSIRVSRAQLVEAHDARVRDALATRHLIRSSGAASRSWPRTPCLAPDLRGEADRAVVLLRHADDAVHELRPSSNWVNWLYAVSSGTATSIACCTGIRRPFPTPGMPPFPPPSSPPRGVARPRPPSPGRRRRRPRRPCCYRVLEVRGDLVSGLGRRTAQPWSGSASECRRCRGSRPRPSWPAAPRRRGRPRPRARGAREGPPPLFGFGDTSPTFLTASRTALPSASRTASPMSFAIELLQLQKSFSPRRVPIAGSMGNGPQARFHAGDDRPGAAHFERRCRCRHPSWGGAGRGSSGRSAAAGKNADGLRVRPQPCGHPRGRDNR